MFHCGTFTCKSIWKSPLRLFALTLWQAHFAQVWWMDILLSSVFTAPLLQSETSFATAALLLKMCFEHHCDCTKKLWFHYSCKEINQLSSLRYHWLLPIMSLLIKTNEQMTCLEIIFTEQWFLAQLVSLSAKFCDSLATTQCNVMLLIFSSGWFVGCLNGFLLLR